VIGIARLAAADFAGGKPKRWRLVAL